MLASPAPLAFWAAILLAITFAGMATLLVGPVVVAPARPRQLARLPTSQS
ncbi:MAG: hypothetical protein U1F67_20300 [Rubrivivax sp.]